MPRPGPRRPQIAVRLAEEEVARIDHLAEQADVNRSEMIRRLLAEELDRQEVKPAS